MLQGTGRATGHRGRPSAGPGAAHGRKGAAHGHNGGNRSGRHNAGHSGRGGHTARGNTPRALPGSAASHTRTISATTGHHPSGKLAGVSGVLTMSGSQPAVLSRGVPAVRWIYWDRATASPGCRPPRVPVRQGAYTAIAFDGQLSSRALVFVLGRPGTSLP